ncbi:MAG: hypothetical protein K0S78_3966 [Thermomicrobiales bacterium]|nr:hypothetical protein [Thermomicrobiales bacterium]
MAEWTGQKRTLNSISTEDDPPLDDTSVHVPRTPQAPAATTSPQLPGMTPDQPALPGRSRGSLPPLASNRRPLTEYGSAQRLLGLFTPKPGTELQASDWEQGPSAMEEQRKADPALLTPIRPLGGVGLGIGRSAPAIPAEALEAIGDATEATTEVPATGEATAAPSAPPATTEPPAAGSPGIPEGAVRGDGTAACPPEFPVKANTQSMIYHTAQSRVYEQTIAELCFSSPEAAETAGYRPPKNL